MVSVPAAVRSAQPRCPQPQASSVSLPASWQYVLQYFSPSGAGQLHAGCAHSFGIQSSPFELKERGAKRGPNQKIRNVKLDESCISKPKTQFVNCRIRPI